MLNVLQVNGKCNMKERVNLTEQERIALNTLGTSNYTSINMKEKSIDELIQQEKANKFNSQVDDFIEKMDKNQADFKDGVDNISYDVNRAEIKPMFARVLVKPFKQNPFQKMKIEGNLIVDAGGYTPHAEMNPVTGKYEEQKEFIVTGYVVDVGPEVKYLQEGDVVYYRIDTAVPVPFFKQGLVSLGESQIIAVVNECLTERFTKINGRQCIL